MRKIIFIFCLLIFATHISANNNKQISVLVLPPADNIVNAGQSPDVMKILTENLSTDSGLQLLSFPYKKLKGVSYLHIFDKRYCKPIVQKVKTDIIVMSEITFDMSKQNPSSWSLAIKIYSTKTNKQITSKVKGENLDGSDITNTIAKSRNVLIKEIKDLAK